MLTVQSHPCLLTPSRLQPTYPLFVFLPGMDGTGQLLRTQTAGLERGFDVRCLAIPPDDLTSWDELTEIVVELIQAELEQSPGRSIYLCGESFGGCLAMKVALHSPDLFERIILVNPASSFNQQMWLSWGSQVTRWLPHLLYHWSSIGLMTLLANLERLASEDRRALLRAVQSVPQKTSIWRLALLHEFYIPETQLKQLTQPVLLIAGLADRLLPSGTEAQRLSQILPNAKTLTLPKSGHACLLEADVNLYEILQTHDFLQPRSELVSAVVSG
ncbi:alpha/beta fold hydrolase [Pantanalinema rosaneae CENA516]|uniref:alpha/beta fold hydrolase n=1 Tax=Pantanalinema rosaneae TaxID=1620701 RepID=UPI003D6DD479